MLLYGKSCYANAPKCYIVRKLPTLFFLWERLFAFMLYLTPLPCVLPALPSDAYIFHCYIYQGIKIVKLHIVHFSVFLLCLIF